jgi:hypothetical protein
MILSLVCLALFLTASPIWAAPGGNGNGSSNRNGGSGNDNGNNPPVVSATPELGSLVLFGTGAAGLASYALMRLRAGRRQDTDTDSD